MPDVLRYICQITGAWGAGGGGGTPLELDVKYTRHTVKEIEDFQDWVKLAKYITQRVYDRVSPFFAQYTLSEISAEEPNVEKGRRMELDTMPKTMRKATMEFHGDKGKKRYHVVWRCSVKSPYKLICTIRRSWYNPNFYSYETKYGKKAPRGSFPDEFALGNSFIIEIPEELGPLE